MDLTDYLQKIPEVAKLLGGWATGILTFLVAYRQYKKSQVSPKNDLIRKYKEMYIKQSMELLEAYESSAKRKRVLIEMELECPSCYKEVIRKLGYEEPAK